MWIAARKGHAGAVSALVRLGADLDATSSAGDGWTALMIAANQGKVECARALLAGGADRTLRSTGRLDKGKTALEIAEARGNAELAALLLDVSVAELPKEVMDNCLLYTSPSPRD